MHSLFPKTLLGAWPAPKRLNIMAKGRCVHRASRITNRQLFRVSSSGFSPLWKPRHTSNQKPVSARIVVPALAGIWKLGSRKRFPNTFLLASVPQSGRLELMGRWFKIRPFFNCLWYYPGYGNPRPGSKPSALFTHRAHQQRPQRTTAAVSVSQRSRPATLTYRHSIQE